MTDITIYEGPGGTIEVRVDRETVWLTQRQMAELFDSSTDNVGLHLKNIYTDNELKEPATTEEYSVVQKATVKIVGDRRVESMKILPLGRPRRVSV